MASKHALGRPPAGLLMPDDDHIAAGFDDDGEPFCVIPRAFAGVNPASKMALAELLMQTATALAPTCVIDAATGQLMILH